MEGRGWILLDLLVIAAGDLRGVCLEAGPTGTKGTTFERCGVAVFSRGVRDVPGGDFAPIRLPRVHLPVTRASVFRFGKNYLPDLVTVCADLLDRALKSFSA